MRQDETYLFKHFLRQPCVDLQQGWLEGREAQHPPDHAARQHEAHCTGHRDHADWELDMCTRHFSDYRNCAHRLLQICFTVSR